MKVNYIISRCLLSILLLSLMFSSVPSYSDDLVQIKKVSSFKSGPYEDVMVYTDSAVEPSVKVLDNPKRLALVFPNSNLCAPVSFIGKTPLIKKIEAVQYDPRTVYVIVEPNKNLNYYYGGFTGNNKFVMEFSNAIPGSRNVIDPPTSDAVVKTKNAPEAAKIFKESFQCVISSGKVYVVRSQTKKMTPTGPKKKPKRQ